MTEQKKVVFVRFKDQSSKTGVRAVVAESMSTITTDKGFVCFRRITKNGQFEPYMVPVENIINISEVDDKTVINV